MTTLQEKRHAALVNQVARRTKERDEAVRWLVRCETRWHDAQKDLARYTKRLASIAAQERAAAAPVAVHAPIEKKPATVDELDIPGFLRRDKDADAAAAAALRAEQAEAKKVKAANRIAKRKAVQAERMMPKQKLAESIRRGGVPG